MTTERTEHSCGRDDGTALGTVMVKNLYSGGGSVENFVIGRVAVLDNNIYYSANDGTHGIELWKSDGTASGTMMVKDINTQIDSNGYNAYSMLSNTAMTATDNMVIFSADDGIHGKELWKSDGTAAGTALLMDLSPGTSSNGYPKESSIGHMATTGELAFFWTSLQITAPTTAAFVTDGTPEGTFAVVNSSSHGVIQSMSRFTAIGDQMYFDKLMCQTSIST